MSNYINISYCGILSVATFADLPTSGISPGEIRVVIDTGEIFVWNGTMWVSEASLNPAFGIIQVDSGTNPVATTPTDTLTITSSNGSILVTGNSATDTVDLTTTGFHTSPLTTKGDVFGYSTGDARIPVGTDGQVLTADSTQILGVKWDTPDTGTITAVTATSPLFSSGGTTPNITIQVANTSQNGYLSSADWNTFDNKQPAGSYITDLSGDVTAAGPGSVVAALTATTNSTITTLTALSLPGSQITGNISGQSGTTNSISGNISTGTNISFTGSGTISSPYVINSSNSGGTVTSVSVVSANGFAGTVATATTTPAITLSTSITGILLGNGTAISAATAGIDYVIPSGSITGTASNITATSNSTLTTLSALSLPYSQITGAPASLIFADSLVNTAGTVTLVNDSTSPTASQYYGTDSGSVLGYFNLPVSGITQLTGDITAGSGTGSQVATLATVNLNVGSFGSSTSIPSFTVNGKGLITAASGNAVVAPAGTLTGTTLNSTILSSSLTSVGTLSSGIWNGSTITVPFGGTGDISFNANQVIIGGTTSTGALAQVAGGTSGLILTSTGATSAPTWQAPATSGTVTGTGAATEVTFWTGTNTISGASNFTFTNTLGSLSVTMIESDQSFVQTILSTATFNETIAGNLDFVFNHNATSTLNVTASPNSLSGLSNIISNVTINASSGQDAASVALFYAQSQLTGLGNVTNLSNFVASTPIISSGTITNYHGFTAQAVNNISTFAFGFDGYLVDGTNQYNLYMGGTAKNFLLGVVGLGSFPVATTQVLIRSATPTSVSSGNGSIGIRGIDALGGTGGVTTDPGSATGGGGGLIQLLSGTGGANSSSLTAATGGIGGAATFESGNGGAATTSGGALNTGGNGGTTSLLGGTGGAASGGTSNVGGIGGNVTVKAGTGGLGDGISGSSGGATTILGGTAAAVAGASAGAVSVTGGTASSTGSGGNGGSVAVSGSNANGDNTVNRAGGNISLVGGASKGSASGGVISGTGGAGGTGTGSAGASGGSVSYTGGTGGAGSATSGNGGALNFAGGTGGAGVAGGIGGQASLIGGVGGTGSSTGGAGGSVAITGGVPGSVAGTNGGAVTITGGAGTSTGSGGNGGTITLNSGAAGGDNTANRAAGAINIIVGAAKGSNLGSSITETAGTGGSGTGTAGANGGSLVYNSGLGGTGSSTNGTGGSITFKTAATTTLATALTITAAGLSGFGVNASPTYLVDVLGGNVGVATAGNGYRTKEGSNAKQGVATLTAGTVIVSNTSVTANSRIFLTAQSLGTVSIPSALAVSTRTAGTSFTILASALTDTSVVAYEIFEPY